MRRELDAKVLGGVWCADATGTRIDGTSLFLFIFFPDVTTSCAAGRGIRRVRSVRDEEGCEPSAGGREGKTTRTSRVVDMTCARNGEAGEQLATSSPTLATDGGMVRWSAWTCANDVQLFRTISDGGMAFFAELNELPAEAAMQAAEAVRHPSLKPSASRNVFFSAVCCLPSALCRHAGQHA